MLRFSRFLPTISNKPNAELYSVYVPRPSTRNTTPLFLRDLEISGTHHQYVCCGSGFCLLQKLYTTNIYVLASLLLLYCSNYLKHLHALLFCLSTSYAVRVQNTSSVLWNVEQLSKLADSDRMCCLSCIYQF